MIQTNTCLTSTAIFRRAINLWLCVGLLLAVTHVLAAPIVSADKVKAAYIYQLTHFASWPNAPSSTKEVFTICVLGNDDISSNLAPLHLRQEKMRLIEVRHPKNINNISNCNILYIAKSEQRRLARIFKQTQKESILTVSSIPNFATDGGIIGFIIVDNKIRLEINNRMAQLANIKLSAKLLEIANVVRNGTPGESQP